MLLFNSGREALSFPGWEVIAAAGKLCPCKKHCPYTSVLSARVVHVFYQVVLTEPGLSNYFTHIDDWPRHESHSIDFWWGLMRGAAEAPRPRAMELGRRDLKFDPREPALRLDLFETAVQQSLPTDVAEQWTMLAREIGTMMAERGMLSCG